MRIIDTFGHGLVTYIDSISASLWDNGLVGYLTGVAIMFHRLDLSGRTGSERVFLIHIDPVMDSKAYGVCLLPMMRGLCFNIEAAFAWRIVINDDLMLLPVTFPGGVNTIAPAFSNIGMR